MTFVVGDRVWWWHTRNHIRRGSIRVIEDGRVGVEPEDARGRGLVYLDKRVIGHIDVGLSS